MFKKFLKDESGATAIEYVLIAAAMAVVLVVAAPTLATAINNQFISIASSISAGK
ncbi:MAG: Flp family type IVb pilin [Aestuariivirga sp.]